MLVYLKTSAFSIYIIANIYDDNLNLFAWFNYEYFSKNVAYCLKFTCVCWALKSNKLKPFVEMEFLELLVDQNLSLRALLDSRRFRNV